MKLFEEKKKVSWKSFARNKKKGGGGSKERVKKMSRTRTWDLRGRNAEQINTFTQKATRQKPTRDTQTRMGE